MIIYYIIPLVTGFDGIKSIKGSQGFKLYNIVRISMKRGQKAFAGGRVSTAEETLTLKLLEKTVVGWENW